MASKGKTDKMWATGRPTPTQQHVLTKMARGWTLLYNIANGASLCKGMKIKTVRVATAQRLCELGLIDRVRGERLVYERVKPPKRHKHDWTPWYDSLSKGWQFRYCGCGDRQARQSKSWRLPDET
jgi:hypothetical protein